MTSSNYIEALHSSSLQSNVVDLDHILDSFPHVDDLAHILNMESNSPSTAYNVSSPLQEHSSVLLSDLEAMPASALAFDDPSDISMCDIWSLMDSDFASHLDATHIPDAMYTLNEALSQDEPLGLCPPSPPMNKTQASSTNIATAGGGNKPSSRLTLHEHYTGKYFAERPSQNLRKSFASSCNTGKMAGLRENAEVQKMSKNWFSERRRRKKYNDKLYILRTLVPKISKMDKASIVSDAIEHVRELQKQVVDRQEEISSLKSRLDAGGYGVVTPGRRRSSSGKYPQLVHKVSKMDVVEMEEGKYQLIIECEELALGQLSRALEALHFDILSASLTSINDHSLGTLVLEAKSLNSKELGETIVEALPKFGLIFM